MTNSHDIVPAYLAVKAMRDNGYKNAAYALAELMDNAIQAEATKVELLCGEQEVQLSQRCSSRIHKIAVLDNGKGMDATVLRLALQFGNGLYLAEEKHTGIGRFGMGLPSSSISQCQRVDVWSWQNGVDSAIHSYLDLDEIIKRQITEVPEPKSDQIPDVWRKVGSSFGETGTLVVWSKIDRCVWKTAKAIIDNSEFLIGRMYRRFLENGKALIRMCAFDIDNPVPIKAEKFASPNDPNYLMAETSCPTPFDKTPMFEPFIGENYEIPFNIDFRGKSHTVTVRFSIAKPEARQGNVPGSLPHGQHAKKNVGVSIIRAGRELELDQSWTIKYKATERWWGIEVDFPPSLDDLFGVTNNKQSARNFSELVDIDFDVLQEEGKTIIQLKQEMAEDDDPRGPLLDIAKKIRTQLGILRKAVDTQREGTRTLRHKSLAAEQAATEVTKERQKEGHKGKSDEGESQPEEERKNEIKQELQNIGYSENIAEELTATTLSVGLKYIFAKADLDGSAFFSVKPKGGEILITLNTNHLAYKNLVEVLEKSVEDVPIETLQNRLQNSLDGLKLLLMAWARYEDEQEGKARQVAQQTRFDWGLVAQQFLERDE